MKEADWKILSRLRPLAVERLYERIWQDILKKTAVTDKDARDRVQGVRDVANKGDKLVAKVFDSTNFSRSNFSFHLYALVAEDLITDEELRQFSDEVQDRLKLWREG
ncbi:peptide ABC transporter substrate-binding protein [Pseudomonas graminis]|uniref:Uncharacterized protein n=1 Tax=Pseudomonas graminis TaxID=158627 RepID=A0A6M8M9Q2_9PSED|nr:peptide ABC transporter substrate-binding protein [Pseudomonas graminis]QKF51509.1 hypothetical protein FX982_02471 [Pseudomonas graminis]